MDKENSGPSMTTLSSKSKVKRRSFLQTPMILENTAAKLFASEAHAFRTPKVYFNPRHVLTSSQEAVRDTDTPLDQLYLEQCHSWFKRETRSRTPRNSVSQTSIYFTDPTTESSKKTVTVNGSSHSSLLYEAKKKVNFKRKDGSTCIKQKKRSRLSCLPKRIVQETEEVVNESKDYFVTSVGMERVQSFLDSFPLCPQDIESPGMTRPLSQVLESTSTVVPSGISENTNTIDSELKCLACDDSDKLNSKNIYKMLANNIGICNRHRIMTHKVLDYQMSMHEEKEYQEDLFWSDCPDDDFEVPFTVNEDRRLRTGVSRFNESNDMFRAMLSNMVFASCRTEDDLKKRWSQLSSASLSQALDQTN